MISLEFQKNKTASALWIKTQSMQSDCKGYEFDKEHTSLNKKCEACDSYKNNRCTNRDEIIDPYDLF